MEQRAIRGIPWTFLTYATNRLIMLGTTVAVAHVLTPADFGVVALALLALNLVGFLRDFGLGGVLVLRQDFDKSAQGTVFVLMVAMGTLAAGTLAVISPLAAKLLGEPRVASVLAALSLTLVIGGFSWFYDALMQRELEFRGRFISYLFQATTYSLVSLLLATAGFGVWSLVVGQIAGAVAQGVMLFTLAPYRIRPSADWHTVRECLSTGRGFMVQGALAFVEQNVDYFAVGRVLGATQLGFYSMAYRLAEVPYWAIADPVAKVTFPTFARMRHSGLDVRAAFLSALRFVAFASVPVGIWLSAAADPLTKTVLGAKWSDMIGPLAVLGIWAALRPVQTTVGWLLNSVGEAWLGGAIAAALTVPMLPGLIVVANVAGITAVSWVMVAAMVLSLFMLAFAVQRRAGVSLHRQWLAIRPVVVASVFAWLSVRGLAIALSGHIPVALVLLVCSTAGLGIYVALVAVLERRLLQETLLYIKRMVAPEPAFASAAGEQARDTRLDGSDARGRPAAPSSSPSD